MKFIVFFLVLLMGVPTGVHAYMTMPRLRPWFIRVLVCLTAVTGLASINFFSNEFYRGTARGMEISAVDLGSVTLIIALFLLRGRRFVWFPRGWWCYGLYFLACLLSVTNAESYLFSFLELWKMAMMWLCLLAIYNYLIATRDYESIFFSFGIVAVLTFVMTVYQKYALGIYQPSGLFDHQNSMAMYLGMVGPVFLARWLNRKKKSTVAADYGVFFVFASASVILTFSRGALLLYPLGCMLTLFVSLLRTVTWRKLRIILGLGLIGIIGLGILLPGIINRYENAPENSRITRINLAIAAKNMANDKTLGVGINNWGIKINPPYEYSEHRTSGRYTEDFKDGLVETIYMMVAAECGWWGLGVLFLWFCYLFLANLVNLKRFFRGPLFWIPAGLAGGMFMNFTQSALEWVLKQSPSFHELMIVMAVIGSMAAWFADEHRPRPRRRTAIPAQTPPPQETIVS